MPGGQGDVPVEHGGFPGNDVDSNQRNGANGAHNHQEKEWVLLQGLQRLDEHYQEMWQQQQILFQALEHLKNDEILLQEALVQVQEPVMTNNNNKQKKPPPTKKNQALLRLQQALLAAQSSSDSSSSSSSSSSSFEMENNDSNSDSEGL